MTQPETSDNGDERPRGAVDRHKSFVCRDNWRIEERRRIETGLSEARKWQAVEPHKSDFWETFYQMLEVHYPDWKWRQEPQTGLSEFAGGESA